MSVSEQIQQEAEKYFLAGTSAAGRFHGVLERPLYLERARGSRLIDVEGNEYIDYHNSAGAAFFGYDHPRLQKAVSKASELGLFMNFESKFHNQLARMLCETIPSAEKVRFSNTGTEATMGALRLARDYTGKDKVLKFEGHFHGMHENIFYNHSNLAKRNLHGQVETTPDSAGFPKNYSDSVIVVDFNNIDAFKHALSKYRGEIAAVILEPISYNCGCMPPKDKYLQQVRDLCSEEKIVLIFDEVLSGFRMCLGGGQEYYGVTPDLTTLAKALGGGFPISALVGKDSIMKHLNPTGNTVMSGTYTGALMPVLAAIECMEMMMEEEFYEEINSKAKTLYDGVNDAFRRHSIRGHLRGIGARFGLFFGINDKQTDFHFRKIVEEFDYQQYVNFVEKCLNRGLYFHMSGWSSGGVTLPTHCGITASHTSEDITKTLERIDEIFEELPTSS